jgi:hypothetical protein
MHLKKIKITQESTEKQEKLKYFCHNFLLQTQKERQSNASTVTQRTIQNVMMSRNKMILNQRCVR